MPRGRPPKPFHELCPAYMRLRVNARLAAYGLPPLTTILTGRRARKPRTGPRGPYLPFHELSPLVMRRRVNARLKGLGLPPLNRLLAKPKPQKRSRPGPPPKPLNAVGRAQARLRVERWVARLGGDVSHLWRRPGRSKPRLTDASPLRVINRVRARLAQMDPALDDEYYRWLQGERKAQRSRDKAARRRQRAKDDPAYGELQRLRKRMQSHRRRIRGGARSSDILAKWEDMGRCCGYCGKAITFDEMEIDHMLPLSRGGTNDLDNLMPSCRTCNNDKADMTVEEWMAV